MLLRYVLAGWLLALLGLLGTHPAGATHLLGGEATGRYLDSNGPAAAPLRYELIVKVYNDCSASEALRESKLPTGIYLNSTLVPLSRVNYSNVYVSLGKTYINLEYESQTPCVQPVQPPGCTVATLAQNYVLCTYRGIINLPATSVGYTVQVYNTGRIAGLTNLSNSVSQSAILTTTLPPPALSNRPPVFLDPAVSLICAGDTAYLPNTAVDADGDRLTYEFVRPAGGGLNQYLSTYVLTYAPGYSLEEPLGMNAGAFAKINGTTGLARFFSRQAGGKYAISIDVREYRTVGGGEVLLNTTRRDLTLVVANCGATLAPLLTAAPQEYTVVAGASLRVPMAAYQATGNSPLSLTVSSLLLDGPGGYEAAFEGDPGTVVPGAPAGTVSRQGVGGTVAGTFTFTPACTAPAAAFDVVLTVLDQGCAGRTTTGVYRINVVPRLAPAAITGSRTVCGAPSTRLYTADGGNGPVRWRAPGGTIVGSATANPVQVRWPAPGTYRLVAWGEAAGSCPPTDSVATVVTVLPGLALSVSGDLAVCPGRSTTLAVSGAPPYTLTGGPTTLTGPGPFTLTPGQTTAYTITGTAPAGGCTPATQLIVRVNPLPVANVGPPTRRAESGVPLPLGAPPMPGYLYQWSPATGLSSPTSANPFLTSGNRTGAPRPVAYTLTVTDAATGCTNSATVTVNVAPDVSLTIYNIVTPNGDQRNDVLYVDNIESYPGSTLTVFNRWGRQVFRTDNYDNQANSWGSGPDVAAGLYYYLFQPPQGPALRGWVEVVK